MSALAAAALALLAGNGAAARDPLALRATAQDTQTAGPQEPEDEGHTSLVPS